MPDHRYLLLLVLVTTACAGPPVDPQPGEAARLAGTWDLLVHRTGQPDIAGSVTLAPSSPDDPTVPQPLKGGTLEGRFHLRNTAWLPAAPRDSGTSAFIDMDSAVTLYLRLEGRCANCGNLGFAGHLVDGRVTGHWIQEVSMAPPEGTFELQRPASE